MINILLFAHLQEAVGESKLTVELSDVTVAQLKEWMEKHYPQLSLQQIMTAINEEFATDTTIVNSGDTIAFIPPISGDDQRGSWLKPTTSLYFQDMNAKKQKEGNSDHAQNPCPCKSHVSRINRHINR